MKLQQSTAVTIMMGPFVDATDGVTAETALSPTVYLSKNGGAFATRNSASAIAHDRDGFYTVPLDATDTNTVGRLIAQVSVGATHAPVWHEFEVLPSSSFAAIISGTGNGIRADVQANQDKTGYSISGTITTLDALDTAQDTQHSTTQSSIAALNDLSSADVQSAMTAQGYTTTRAPYIDELAAANLPTDVAANASAIAALNDPTAAAIADAVWDEARSGHTAVGSFGESIQTAAVATASSIAALNDLSSADVQTALTSQGLTTTRAGYLDELGPTNIPADVDAILVDTAALDTRLTATRAGYLDNLSAGAVALQATVTALNDLSASEVENAVWDATMASHTTAGTTGEALDSAGGGATPSAIADAVWDEARSGHTSAGTFGEAIQTAAVATAASISALNDLSAADVASELATYDAATGTEAAAISSAIAALNDLDSTAVQAAAAAALIAYDPATGTEAAAISSAISALNDLDSTATQAACAAALVAYAPAVAGDAMTLTSGERTSIATAVNGQVIYWVVDGGASAANISFPSNDYPSKVRRRGWIDNEAGAAAATYGAADGADSEDICIVVTGSQVTGKPYASQWRYRSTT